MLEEKFCKFCGKKIPKDSIVCPKCGRQLELVNNAPINNSNMGESKPTETKNKKDNTKALEIVRYVFGSIFIFIGFLNLFMSFFLGLVQILFGVSLFPILYKKIFSEQGLKKYGKIVQICFPIIMIIMVVSFSNAYQEKYKNEYISKIISIYNKASEYFVSDMLYSENADANEYIYSVVNGKTCTNLKKTTFDTDKNDIDYVIKFSSSGDVIEFVAQNDNYFYGYKGTGLLASEIEDVYSVSEKNVSFSEKVCGMYGTEENTNTPKKDEETLEQKLLKKVKKILRSNQKIVNFELVNETSKYEFEINNTSEDITPYVCSKDVKELVSNSDILGNEYIDNISFNCNKNDELIYRINVNNISSISNEDQIEENMIFINKSGKEEKTSIKKLEEKDINDYKSSCAKYKYKDVLRNPEKYTGKRAYWFGEIVQVVSKSSVGSTFRINVSCTKYKYMSGYSCPDTIYVTYYGSDSFIEDDMVKMWGTMNGTKTYETVLGASLTIPQFNAEYMTLSK